MNIAVRIKTHTQKDKVTHLYGRVLLPFNSLRPCYFLIHTDHLESYVTFRSVAFVIEYIPVWLAKTNRSTAISLAWKKDSLVFVNVYRGKEWNKAIHNGLALPLVLTWYCQASQNSKMAAEVFREWRRKLNIQDGAQT